MKTSRKFISATALLSTLLFSLPAMADGAKQPGIITSSAISATISTKDMPSGSEMWAIWVSLPAGKRVQTAEGASPSTWMETDLNLSGSSVSGSSVPQGRCIPFGTGWRQDFSAKEDSGKAGDAFACSYGVGFPYWEENRGTELYTRAQLNIGGPFAYGQTDTPEEYRKAGGQALSMSAEAGAFRTIEQEMRAAGAMTSTIRQVTMPPGSKSVATDRYPTLRMVTGGKLNWGAVPPGPDLSVMPKVMSEKNRFDWVGWSGPGSVVLLNKSDKPVEFVEWSVAPAPGAAP